MPSPASTCAAKARVVSLLVLGLVELSCSSGRLPAEHASPQPQASRSTANAQFVTIADASAACQRIQANERIPVSCSTDYVDRVPSMFVGFRNFGEGERWLAPFARMVGGPFCDAANRNGREAQIYMTVGIGEQQQARRWSCEFGHWGRWFATAPERPRAPSLHEAMTACQRVQADQQLPVTCHTMQVNGGPAIIVGFPDAERADEYIQRVSQDVAGPFCVAANNAQQSGSFFITLANTQARHFDCQRQTWGRWFDLEGPNDLHRTML